MVGAVRPRALIWNLICSFIYRPQLRGLIQISHDWFKPKHQERRVDTHQASTLKVSQLQSGLLFLTMLMMCVWNKAPVQTSLMERDTWLHTHTHRFCLLSIIARKSKWLRHQQQQQQQLSRGKQRRGEWSRRDPDYLLQSNGGMWRDGSRVGLVGWFIRLQKPHLQRILARRSLTTESILLLLVCVACLRRCSQKPDSTRMSNLSSTLDP